MEQKNETKQMRTQVFNVIILDKSGSMECIRQAAVSGFNETLNGIKKAQEKFADTQEHFVSLLTFCDCEKKYVFDKVPVIWRWQTKHSMKRKANSEGGHHEIEVAVL